MVDYKTGVVSLRKYGEFFGTTEEQYSPSVSMAVEALDQIKEYSDGTLTNLNSNLVFVLREWGDAKVV